MAVIHAKVSGKADGGDATLVQPTDWNASHSIGDIIPAAANTYDLGSAASAFDIAYVRNVAFPATQSPSADANTLDDYQEGTWTPAPKFGGGNTGWVWASLVGAYTKIGRLVMFGAQLALTTNGSSAGNMTIDGLPFALGTSIGGCYAAWYANMNVGYVSLMGLIDAGTTIDMFMSGENTTPITDTHVPDGAYMYLVGQYFSA